ncbi:MAG: LysR family transcriptional regulator [Acidimicrobiales bacterium]
MDIQLHRLKYFVAVAETGNVTRAAALVHIAQPSVSAQILKLEAELGVALFHRDPTGMQLTEAGQTLLPLARNVLSGAEEAVERVRELAGLRTGRLRIGATPSLARALLPEALVRFHREHPGISIELTEGASSDLASELETGTLELALLKLPVKSKTLATRPLAEEELVCAVAHDHPLASRRRMRFSDLHDIPMVMFGASYSLHRETVDAFAAAGLKLVIASEGGDIDGVLALAAAGLGAAIVPSIIAHGHRGIHVIRLTGPTPSRHIGFAQRSGRVPSHAAREFTAQILSLLSTSGWPGRRPEGFKMLAPRPAGQPASVPVPNSQLARHEP